MRLWTDAMAVLSAAGVVKDGAAAPVVIKVLMKLQVMMDIIHNKFSSRS